MKPIQNFIGGRWTDAESGEQIPVFEPATGLEYTRAPRSGEADVKKAVAAAQAALPEWSRRSHDERSKVLRRIAAGIHSELEALARAESQDSGKPLSLARSMDIPRAAQNFEFFADAITQGASETFESGAGVFNYTLRHPLGVVATITPWNLPLYLFTWKVAPALAAGNTVVAKPSEVTPLTAHLFSKIAHEAGLPAGVLNIVHGLGESVGGALSRHPDIRAISFTGSTKTGARIAETSAGSFKKLSLEMGGKNPFIVFGDADLELAALTAARAAFLNQGQICLCGSRILVEESVYAEFKAKLLKKVGTLRVGDPLETGTDQGALVSEEHFKKISACVERAVAEGGKVLTGGKPLKFSGRCASGWFFEPTLIEGLGPQCQTNQEEIFGPVATLIPFKSEDEALAIANGTTFGLAASLFTRDLSRAHRLASRIDAGVVWINAWMNRDLRTPFGGTKQSGLGREGGRYALEFFTEVKNVCVGVESP